MLELRKVFPAYQLASLLDSVCWVFLYFHLNIPKELSSVGCKIFFPDLLRGSLWCSFQCVSQNQVEDVQRYLCVAENVMMYVQVV